VMMVNDKVYGEVTADRCREILKAIMEEETVVKE